MLQGVKLNQTQCPTNAEDREKMKGVPCASVIGSIMYATLSSGCDIWVCLSDLCLVFLSFLPPFPPPSVKRSPLGFHPTTVCAL